MSTLLLVTCDRATIELAPFLDVDVLRADDIPEAETLLAGEPGSMVAYGPDCAAAALWAADVEFPALPVQRLYNVFSVVLAPPGDPFAERGAELLGAAMVIRVPGGLSLLSQLLTDRGRLARWPS